MSRFPLFIAILAFLVLGAAFGFFGEKIIYPPLEVQTPLLTAPIPIETLKSSLYDKFYAQVRGVVVRKETDKFVVKQRDEEIILHVVFNGLTTFKKSDRYISYEEMQVGDYVTGGISIENTRFQEGEDETSSYEIIAHQFIVRQLPESLPQ